MIIGTRVDLVCTFNLWLFIPKLLQSVKIAVYENEYAKANNIFLFRMSL